MLKKLVFLAVFAALVIVNLSAASAQTGVPYIQPSGSGLQANQYVQGAPVIEFTSEIPPVPTVPVNQPTTSISQPRSHGAAQVLPNSFPMVTAYRFLAPAPAIPNQPVVEHVPAVYSPTTYAPAVTYPVMPMQPVCTSGG